MCRKALESTPLSIPANEKETAQARMVRAALVSWHQLIIQKERNDNFLAISLAFS